MSGAPAASGGLRAVLSYCVQQVRSYDYHNYLCLLHLPPSMRRAAFTFRAFNVETSANKLVEHPVALRLLWWKDLIDKIYANKLVEHPVALALSSVLSEQKISKHWLKRSLEARINDGNRDEYDIPETIAELERYSEDTQSTILYMTLQAGGIQSTIADHAASHIGKASGLLLLLKALPHHVNKQGKMPYIPASVAEECGLLRQEGGRSEVRMGETLPDAVFKVASVAEAHLQKVRELASSLPAQAAPVLPPSRADPGPSGLPTTPRIQCLRFTFVQGSPWHISSVVPAKAQLARMAKQVTEFIRRVQVVFVESSDQCVLAQTKSGVSIYQNVIRLVEEKKTLHCHCCNLLSLSN